MMLAELHAVENRLPQAVRAAQDALQLTKENATLLQASMIFIRAERRAEAQSIAQTLRNQFQKRSQAYGAIVEGELARASQQYVQAAEAFHRAQGLSDLWLGRFLLGRTYVEAEQFPLAQGELGLAERRQLEASAVFLDDVPSYRYLAPLPYWLGRVQAGINKSSPTAAENYKKFLLLRPEGSRDPLAADARKRLGLR
jgi:hypothetical protein